MFKYPFCIVFIILASHCGVAYSQAQPDTSLRTTDTVTTTFDSSSKSTDSSAELTDSARAEINEDSLYMPVKDSDYLNNYTVRTVSQLKVNKYLADRDYEYANDPEYWEKDKVHPDPGSFSIWNLFRNKIVQWIIFLSVIAVILYGTYLLAKENNFNWLSRNGKKGVTKGGEPEAEESADYEETIRKYQSEGNYRMAIRYMYLRLIRSAIEKEIILIRESSTNSEIVNAFGSPELASEFRYLATAYEYIYFGDFSFNLEIYNVLKEKFDVFQKKLAA
jgi:hypothetical protein